jgi:hypothetical protein
LDILTLSHAPLLTHKSIVIHSTESFFSFLYIFQQKEDFLSFDCTGIFRNYFYFIMKVSFSGIVKSLKHNIVSSKKNRDRRQSWSQESLENIMYASEVFTREILEEDMEGSRMGIRRRSSGWIEVGSFAPDIPEPFQHNYMLSLQDEEDQEDYDDDRLEDQQVSNSNQLEPAHDDERACSKDQAATVADTAMDVEVDEKNIYNNSGQQLSQKTLVHNNSGLMNSGSLSGGGGFEMNAADAGRIRFTPLSRSIAMVPENLPVLPDEDFDMEDLCLNLNVEDLSVSFIDSQDNIAMSVDSAFFRRSSF